MKIHHDDHIRIIALRDAGIGYGTIAKQLGFKKDTVAKHCQKTDHLSHLPPKEIKYHGKIQGRKQLEIKEYIMWNPLDSLHDIILGCDLDCSTTSLFRYLNRFGMDTHTAQRRIIISDENKRKRMEFCKEMLKKTDAELRSIWFSDETIVKSRPNGEIILFRCPPGSVYYEPSNASSSKSVMFWGVMSFDAYGPLVEVKGKNTAASYIDTLEEYLLPEIGLAKGDVVFQQDNARIHKTAAVLSFLEENIVNILQWPPQSPDLSPIENVWNAMKMKMKALKPRPRTYAKMRDAMLQIWSELSDELRKDLLDTFRGRLEKCLKAKGDLIKF